MSRYAQPAIVNGKSGARHRHEIGRREPETTSLTFLPEGVTLPAEVGDTILDVARRHDVPLGHECGGNCACTTCQVLVSVGSANLSAMEEVEADRLSTAEDHTEASRLSCQAILQGGDVTVWIPEPSTET